jgi:hypothetical protein
MTEQKTPVLEPKAQQFIDAVVAQGGKPLYTLSHADARKVLEDAQYGAIAKHDAHGPVYRDGNLSCRANRECLVFNLAQQKTRRISLG